MKKPNLRESRPGRVESISDRASNRAKAPCRKPAVNTAVRGGPLNKPRLHFYDPSLVMAAENAKFRQRDFSDCHWCTLLLLAYRASSYTKAEYDKAKAAGTINGLAQRRASALEMVLRAYVDRGPREAKKLAALLEAEGESFPPWMKLRTSEYWKQQVKGPAPRFLFNEYGFICGNRPLDGD